MNESSPLYPNQPICEVATEARFLGDLKIDQIRAPFQKKINEDYPTLKVPAALQGVAPSLQPIRFESSLGDSAVQLAINSISYVSKNYRGYEEFLNAFVLATQPFFDLIPEIHVTRVGWRYINRINFTREDGLLPLYRIFKQNDLFGTALICELEEVSYKAVAPKGDSRLSVKVEASHSLNDSTEEAILLDIDAFQVMDPPVVMNGENVILSVKAMHDVARATFESLITDGYREFLKGDDNE